MTDEIETIKTNPKSVAAWKREYEQLQARVAELEAIIEGYAPYHSINAQLAAEQAAHAAAVLNNQQLRDALQKHQDDKLHKTGHDRNHSLSKLAVSGYMQTGLYAETEQALATPLSTEALDKYVAEKVKELHSEIDCWQKATAENENKWIDACDQISELTRQRDLAVETMREALECGEDGDWQSARRILTSTIKESE